MQGRKVKAVATGGAGQTRNWQCGGHTSRRTHVRSSVLWRRSVRPSSSDLTVNEPSLKECRTTSILSSN
jgi:hypothetical protein